MQPNYQTENKERGMKFFVVSAGILLTITGIAKIISVFGKERILDMADPVFQVSIRHVMIAAGTIELLVGLVCFFNRKLHLSVGLVAWIVTNFIIYRISLLFIDWPAPCHCMGTITDVLHISPHVADLIIKVILVYLAIGGYGYLLLHWTFKKLNKL